ncbi:sensor domain-containing diguanylate cyclase [Marinomonas sp. C2222]|uniref:diguanylate cyclase n=1 Tax=Marinomonas sargassi TaxID=2984494 RepID=A0ABT2YUN2_9GAMM|nr:diguanylate cyclase [Marinomonas sargassi]MCV2403607.1 sensor domain-containing diguanylate cyclase [Marinomonas sargassi]
MSETIISKTFISFLMLLSLNVFGAPILNFDGSQQDIALSGYIDELEDQDKAFTLDQLTGQLSDEFQPNIKTTINYTFSDSAYWLRFSILNSTHTKQTLYLQNKVTWIDSLTFYQPNINGGYLASKTGSDITIEKRPLEHRSLVFSFDLEPDQESTYYLRVESVDALILPLFLTTENEFYKKDTLVNYFIGALLGVILVMSVYNLFIYNVIRDKVYLWYSFYVLFYGVNFLITQNLFFPSIKNSQDGWSEFLHLGPLNLYFLFIILFTGKFLNIKAQFPKLNYVLNFLIVLLVAASLSYFIFSYRVAMPLSANIVTLIPFILIGVGIYCYRKGVALAKFYIIAWLPNCALFLVFAFTFHGLLPYNLYTSFANDVGMVIEAVLLSLALAYRVRIFQKEAYTAQEQLLIEQKAQTEKLHSMVEQRTKELRTKNAELERLSITDKLTNLFNRRKLDNVLLSNVMHAKRYKKPLGVMLLDLDNFKNINDCFGHHEGDEVLQKVASLLMANCREKDIVGRWGGEEFLVICPMTEKEELLMVAERLRAAISDYDSPEIVSFSASFGTACYQHGENPELLVSRADKALYQSKANGKNQVSFAN